MGYTFDNTFKSGFEDYMTVTSILENCPDQEKVKEFFKSVLPNTVMEQKLQKLVELNKSVTAKKEEKETVKTLSKSFEAAFAEASK